MLQENPPFPHQENPPTPPPLENPRVAAPRIEPTVAVTEAVEHVEEAAAAA